MRKRKQQHPRSDQAQEIIDLRRAHRSEAADKCKDLLVPKARSYFREHLDSVLALSGDERSRRLFYLHRDAICETYKTTIDISLESIPVTTYDPLDPASKRDAYPWLLDIIRDHAQVAGMTEPEFGELMASGFAFMHNKAVRAYNELITMSPFGQASGPLGRAADFNAYARMRRRMTPEQLERFEAAEREWDDHKSQAEQVALLWKQFCYAYSVYDEQVARSLD